MRKKINTLNLWTLAVLLYSTSSLAIWPQKIEDDTYGSDMFFDRLLYEKLPHRYSNERIDGALVGHPGKRLMREEICVIALERFEEAILAAGLEPWEVTEAIFRGTFNPYYVDIYLAFEGLVPYGSITLAEINPTYYEFQLENGMIKKDDPPEIANQKGHDIARAEVWNANYGAITDIEEVNTLVSGKEEILSYMDIGLRLKMRKFGSAPGGRGRGSRGRGVAPIIPGALHDWEKYSSELRRTRGESFVTRVEEEILYELERICAVTFFYFTGKNDQLDFFQDYKDLRLFRYLKNKGEGKDIKDRPGTLR